jgi:hypothetical protein
MAGSPDVEHLAAESAAWPLSSESGFRLALGHLQQEAPGRLERKTRALEQDLLEHLRLRARGLSLESLARLIEGTWFGEAPEGTSAPGQQRHPLALYLSWLAQKHLDLSGHRVVLRRSTEAPEAIAGRWRWLSFVLPPDVLVVALGAARGMAPPRSFVSLQLANTPDFISDEGIANTHLHLGAAFPFELFWTNVMTRAGGDEFVAARLSGEGHIPFGSGHAFLSWLVTAALTRLTLASYLWHRDTGHAESFAPFVTSIVRRQMQGEEHVEALSALGRGASPVPFARLRPVLRRFGGTTHRARLPSTPEEACELDPLWRWRRDPPGAPPETHFLYRGLSYLLREHPGDDTFARLFWQYLRIRCQTYRYLVQEPGSAGLDWFSLHFQRISALRKGLDAARMSSALALESRGARLRSIEVRGSPSPSWSQVRDLALQVATARAPEGCEPERGLVLHFAKELRHPSTGLLHADPRQWAHGCRYGSYFHARLREAMAVEAALRHHPELLVILRGLDVCNTELSVPTWVLLPILARVRRHSERISAHLGRWGNVPPLRLTMHVGEDFRRLVEGLRRIHEPIEFGVLGAGDRLGHAVALGVEPAAWASTSASAWQPAEERLDDLLWELERYRRGEMSPVPARLERLRGELHPLTRRLYGRHFTEDDLLQARALRHDPNVLERLGFPFLRGHRAWQTGRPLQLLLRYLTDPDVYARGQVPIEVRIDKNEVQMLEEAQGFLRRLLGQLGIVVEVNPSSNVLIGDFPLEQHPIFRLQPLPHQGTPCPPVLVTMGDDDPLTFASCLPDEFGHLFYALIRRGVSVQHAQEWLDRVRRNGLNSRFTLSESVVRQATRSRPRRH